MIHRFEFEKKISGVSYIYVANSTIVLLWEIEYVLRVIKELRKNNKQQQCQLYKLKKNKETYMKIHRQLHKLNKNINWLTIHLNSPNKKEVIKFLTLLNPTNCITIGKNVNSLTYKLSVVKVFKLIYNIFKIYLITWQNDNISRNKIKNSIIDSIIKKNLDIKSFLKINETLVNIMKYQCSEKSNRFANIGNRDCIEKKILRPTRQASHMRKTLSNRKTSIQYKTSKRKINTKPIDKIEFCANKNTCLNVNKEKFNNVDNCKKNTSQEGSHIDTMSLFYEVVDTKNHNRPNNYEIADNYLKQNIKQKPTLIVKFKKIRQSELSLLNGEAENFMFPKRFSYDKQNSVKCERSPMKRSFSNSFESTSDCKLNNVERCSRQSENSLLHNNSRNTNSCPTSDAKSNSKIADYNFSFEKIPSDETWFNVFRRQDESKEKTFEYYGSTGFRKLPYEMGPIPSVQNCRTCTLQEPEHINMKIKTPTEEIPLAKQSGSKKTENDTKNVSSQIHENSSSSHKNFEMPRISPREHASTLAILSCLIKKSNNEVDLLSTNGQPTQNDNIYSNSQILNLIESVKSLRKKSNTSYKNKNKNITDMEVNKNCSNNKTRNLENYVNMQKLTNELDSFLVSSFSENTDHLIFNQSINYFSNDMNLLEITENQYQQESINKALCTNKYKTKRKNNKTGWPKKKKILTRQQKTKVTDNKTKNSEFIKRMSPMTPPYSDSEESMQCSYLNILDDNFQHSYFNGVEPDSNSIEKKTDDSDCRYTKNIKYILDKTNATEKQIEYSLQPNLKFNCSPRKLRKLRGRYRER